MLYPDFASKLHTATQLVLLLLVCCMCMPTYLCEQGEINLLTASSKVPAEGHLFAQVVEAYCLLGQCPTPLNVHVCAYYVSCVHVHANIMSCT